MLVYYWCVLVSLGLNTCFWLRIKPGIKLLTSVLYIEDVPSTSGAYWYGQGF
jgi:hypothetical protein